MSDLPKDIVDRVEATFMDPQIQQKVIKSLEALGQINVGQNQLRRGIVFLADGNYERFLELRKTFMGDPRDLLIKANSLLVKKDYWFGTPFKDMGPLKEP